MNSSTSPCSGRSTTPDMWEGVIEYVENARTIAISGHTNPDGDALGSLLGLGASIRAQFPDKKVDLLLADDGSIPRVYRFLAGADELEPAVRHDERYDVFISVDVPTLGRLADSAAVAKRAHGRVVIDHHPTCEEFGDVTVRVTSAAATAVLVEELLNRLAVHPRYRHVPAHRCRDRYRQVPVPKCEPFRLRLRLALG